MSVKRTTGFMVVKKKLIGGIMILALFSGMGAIPTSKAVAATDAEIIAMIQSILAVIQQLRNQINTQTTGTPTGLTQVPDKFPDSVTMGSTNDSIQLLQKILATDSTIYPSGLTTGTFGDLTAEGLRKFQEKFHLPVTGTFTPETEYVLNNALSVASIDSYPQNYLTNSVVTEKINSSADAYLLGNVVINGKVALRPFPVFSASTKSSDTATLQRIMKTDSLIYNGEITGLMDSATLQGVVKLNKRYGLPFTSVAVNNLMNATTVTLINRILSVNNSATIKTTLLKESAVAPSLMVANSEREIELIRVVKNYRGLNVEVTVVYKGGSKETFTSTAFTPDTTVIGAIATRLVRSVSEISSKTTFSSLYAKEPKRIDLTFKIQKKEEIDIDVTYRDDSTELFRTTKADETQIIDDYFGGNEERFNNLRDSYLDRARVGDVDPLLYEFIAGYINIPITQVRNIVTVTVDDNDPGTQDPTGGGGS